MDQPLDKSTVARILREISVLLQVKGENAFKSRAYDVAADRIAGIPGDLATLVAEKKLRTLPGIGAAIEEKITELVTTGKLEYHQQLLADYPPGIIELLKVQDLGPKKAATLWKQLGIGDVDSLEKACREGQLRGIKGFGEKSEAKILEGITQMRAQQADFRQRLGDVLPISEQLLARVRATPGVIRASVAGSVRRFRETVADVDLIASSADPVPVMRAFATDSHVAKVIAHGETKCSVRLFQPDIQVDLRVVPDEDYATALHHFTGSKAHHIRLRGRAQERGLKISEWGLHRGEEKLPVPDEQTLYRLLDLAYVPPELREDWGEVEAAEAATLPARLLELEDVQGNVHSHSVWSDGKDSLEAMAHAARAQGLSYLTVTEHSQAAHYAGGLTEDALRRQWDEIDALNEKLEGIRLLKGIEVDILEDGTLDYPERILQQLEVVIASVHVRHSQDEDQMTRRVLAAFDNPYLHILGHATGRLINTRAPYGLRMAEVFEKAQRKGVVIEVNGNPHRLDLHAEHVRQALLQGVKLVVSTDSHSVRELAHLRFSVGTARKGWARKEDVLNTLPVAEFSHTLRTMRC